jgi:hypothetical protein
VEQARFAARAGAAILALAAAVALAASTTALTVPGAAAGVPKLVPVPLEVQANVLTPAEAAGLPPTIQDGIGPGSALQQQGEAGGFLCTAAFLLRDPQTATYYLSTAGHCLVNDESDPAPYTGHANPDKVVRSVLVCVEGCVDNALSVGTYVTLSAGDGYHPVAFAQSGGIGGDFGLVELPTEVHDLLRPSMPQWGGPTGVAADAGSGDLLVHYGHGTYCCPVAGGVASRTPADQGRAATALSSDASSFQAVGWITGGDSGSGISLAVPDGAGALRGTEALGVITHGLEGPGTVFYGTMLRHGLDLAREATGLRLELVPEGDPLSAVPDPAELARIAIVAPAPGAVVRPVSGAVPVQGNASVGGRAPGPGERIEVSLDDPAFGNASRLPVAGNASWTAMWYTAASPSGNHTLYARLVDANGTLAEHNRTVRLSKTAGAVGGSVSLTTSGSKAKAGGEATRSSSAGGGGPTIKVPAVPMPLVAAALAASALAWRRKAPPGSRR